MIGFIRKLPIDDLLNAADTIIELVEESKNQLAPHPFLEYMYQNDIEAPSVQSIHDLRTSTSDIHASLRLPYLFKAVKLLHQHSPANSRLLENSIWLSYHLEDLSSMQHYLYAYLQQPTYDSKTLAYAINAYVLNCDVEFSKNLFKTIVEMGRPLENVFLTATVINFVNVGALFENLQAIFKYWVDRSTCAPPHAKTIALLIRQYQKYGHSDEILALESVIQDLKLSNNFIVQLARLESDVLERDVNQKKVLTEKDVSRFYRIKNAIVDSPAELQVFYESCLAFFARHTKTEVVQLILEEMLQDNIPISEFSFDVILRHYLAERKFIPLLSFTQNMLLKSQPFHLVHAKYLFDAFVRNFPHEAESFGYQFHEWVKSCGLRPDEKQRLLESCKLLLLNSSMSPFNVSKSEIGNQKKYDSSQWSSLNFATDNKNKEVYKQQVRFRMNKGLSDLIGKGIKPDYAVLENTLKQLNYAYRVNLLRLLEPLRMTKNLTRMQIIHMLLSDTSKRDVEVFAKLMKKRLSTSDKIFLARRLMNNYSYKDALGLLESVNEIDMTDQREMMILNWKLRIGIGSNDFNLVQRITNEFPVNDVLMNPYILQQCCYIEKSLIRKIKALEAKPNSALSGSIDDMKKSLERLRGLIGDIQLRLDQDKKEIQEKVLEMFVMLDTWIQQLKSNELNP